MSFRLASRLMTLDNLELLQVRIFLEFRAISHIWKATTAKRMEIGPRCKRQNCNPLNVFLIDVQISSILLGIPPLWATILCLQYGSISIRLAVVAFKMCEIARNSKKIRTYSSSRSSKVINLGANRKLISNFLLVIKVTLDVSRTFFEILPLKARKILVLPTPPWFDALAPGDPCRIL